MNFTDKIKKLERFLLGIVRPSIVEYITLHKESKDHFVTDWQRNCCKQTSIIVNVLLRDILLKTNSGYYEIQSWEGIFMDVVQGKQTKYNHCWVYCLHDDPNKNLLIDIARHHKENLVMFTRENQFPRNHPDYRRMYALDVQQLDVDFHLHQEEYFTKKRGHQFLRELKRYMSTQHLLTQKATEQVAA